MKYPVTVFMLAMFSILVAESADKKELTAEELAKQEKLVAEFGEFGKEYSSASRYKACTLAELKISKKEMKNKKVQYEGTFQRFNDTFPKYMEDAGYSSKKYYYLIVGNAQLPVLARRTKNIAELLGKLKPGYLLRIYGRVKEFKSKDRRGMMPEYYIEFASAQVLSTEIKAADNADHKDKRKGNDGRPKRRWKR